SRSSATPEPASPASSKRSVLRSTEAPHGRGATSTNSWPTPRNRWPSNSPSPPKTTPGPSPVAIGGQEGQQHTSSPLRAASAQTARTRSTNASSASSDSRRTSSSELSSCPRDVSRNY